MALIKLYTTFYPEKNRERNKELLACLKFNLDNANINLVVVFNEGGDLGDFISEKLKVVAINQRPTYQGFF